MQVQQILSSKADSTVVTVRPGSLVLDAAKLLAEKGIGTVVVSEDGVSAIGILSERDVVRELARTGSACLNVKVDDVMTKQLVTCDLHTPAEKVMQDMTGGRFRHMPVVENGQMVGLITLGDVVKARLSELEMEKDSLEGMIMGF